MAMNIDKISLHTYLQTKTIHWIKCKGEKAKMNIAFFSRYVLRLALVVAVLLNCAAAKAETIELIQPNVDPRNSCSADNCSIPVERLTTQADRPYLFIRVMDDKHPQWDDFKGYIESYPNARACLVEEEMQRVAPNLLAIDWQKFDSSRDMNVCLFRILTNLPNSGSIMAWLEFHEFRSPGVYELYSDMTKPRGVLQPVFQIDAVWSPEQYYRRRPSLLWNAFGFTLLNSFSMHIGFNSEGDIVEIATSSNSL